MLWIDAGQDPGMDGETVTYAGALYDKDEKLAGVISAGILVDDIFDTLEKIKKGIPGQ